MFYKMTQLKHKCSRKSFKKVTNQKCYFCSSQIHITETSLPPPSAKLSFKVNWNILSRVLWQVVTLLFFFWYRMSWVGQHTQCFSALGSLLEVPMVFLSNHLYLSPRFFILLYNLWLYFLGTNNTWPVRTFT